MKRVLLAVPVMLLAVGCGSSSKPAAQPASTPAPTPSVCIGEACPGGEGQPSASPSIDTEGSVTTADGSFVEYPDGVVVRLVRMQRLPANLSGHIDEQGQVTPLPSDQVLIRATLSVKNGSAQPLAEFDTHAHMTLLYGENRYEAEQDSGYLGAPPPELNPKLPTRVAVGSTVEVSESFDVPASDVNVLAVQAQINTAVYTDYTFTDAQTLLRT